jgi:SSS family solute:Na+ symporter
VQGYLAPPIAAVFFFGVFNKRINARGCLAALTIGFALGIFRLAVDTPVSLGMDGFAGGYAPGSWLWIVNNIYFQYYSLLIFLVSSAVLVGVSYATDAPDPAQLRDLTFATMSEELRRESRASWTAIDVVNSGIVVALILGAYLYFNG